MTKQHERFIRQTIELARQAVQNGNHPFGALLVVDREVLVTDENTVNTERDATRHAELNLVSRAMRRFDADLLSRSVLYTSTEPCAMCAGAIYWAGIPTVVYGCPAETLVEIAGESLLVPCREIFARGATPIEVIGPVLEAEARSIHDGFWR